MKRAAARNYTHRAEEDEHHVPREAVRLEYVGARAGGALLGGELRVAEQNCEGRNHLDEKYGPIQVDAGLHLRDCQATKCNQ